MDPNDRPEAPDLDPPVAGIKAGEETLQLLPDGPAGFEALIALIDGAKTDLRVLYYTFSNDESGTKVLERLVAAQKRGVTVALIVDDFGSLETPDDFFDPLMDCGGRFCEFQPAMWKAYLLRNHQKMTIADGERAIVGSFNVADEHLQEGGADSFRDMGVQIEGPAAARLAAYYDRLEDWMRSDKIRIRDLRDILDDAHEPDGPVRWVIGGPSRGRNHYLHQIEHEFMNADGIDMIMAYFSPTRRILAAVRRIARDGQLRLISAGKTDVKMSRAAAWHTYSKLLKAGAEIYEYQPSRLHTKLIVTTDAVYIGSGNFDVRSLYVNLEIMLRVEREAFRKEVCKLFEGELAQSERITSQTVRAESQWYNRLRWRLSYIVMASVDRFLSRWLAR